MKKTTIIDVANAPELSDEELSAAYYAQGDKSILAALFRKYMSLVFGVCMKYLKEKTEAQDATMEVFEKLIQHQPNYEINNFKAFLYVVSKNHCLMKQRGEKNMIIEVSDADIESAIEVHPLDVEKEENHELLEKCLKELKDLQQQCVEQFYLKKNSYLEISKSLKVTLSAVKSHIQNGKRNLKSCMSTS